jgi:hypothetical protein
MMAPSPPEYERLRKKMIEQNTKVLNNLGLPGIAQQKKTFKRLKDKR